MQHATSNIPALARLRLALAIRSTRSSATFRRKTVPIRVICQSTTLVIMISRTHLVLAALLSGTLINSGLTACLDELIACLVALSLLPVSVITPAYSTVGDESLTIARNERRPTPVSTNTSAHSPGFSDLAVALAHLLPLTLRFQPWPTPRRPARPTCP